MTAGKGRGGKKPRYEIPDIAGSDLTSQDRSMERVLDFMVRGGLETDSRPDETLIEQSAQPKDPQIRTAPEPLSPASSAISVPNPQSPVESASPAAPKKKSLDHLFSRSRLSDKEQKPPAEMNAPQTALPSPSPVLEEPADSVKPEAKPLAPEQPSPVEPTAIVSKEQAESAKAEPNIEPIPAASRQDLTPPPSVSEPPASALGLTSRHSDKAAARLSGSPAGVPVKAQISVKDTAALSEVPSFEEFRAQFGSFIKDSHLQVCEVIYKNTFAMGRLEYFTTTSELTKSVRVQQRQCFNILSKLESLGFIKRTSIEENGRLLGINLSLVFNPFK